MGPVYGFALGRKAKWGRLFPPDYYTRELGPGTLTGTRALFGAMKYRLPRWDESTQDGAVGG